MLAAPWPPRRLGQLEESHPRTCWQHSRRLIRNVDSTARLNCRLAALTKVWLYIPAPIIGVAIAVRRKTEAVASKIALNAGVANKPTVGGSNRAAQ